MTQSEAKIVALLEQALAGLKALPRQRADAMRHVGEAIRDLRTPQTGIPPEDLSSANDG